MKRLAASTLFAVSVLQMSHAGAQTPGNDAAASAAVKDPAATVAGEVARQALAERDKAASDAIRVVSVAPATFRDASLGCRRPGTVAAQVITEGYAVMLEKGGEHRRVNVVGERAVICDFVPRFRNPSQPPAARATGLDKMTVQAREDLAKRLHIDASQIRVARIEPQRWADETLGCDTPKVSSTQGPVAGYRLHLVASERTFTYHSDGTKVIVCPPLEAE